MTRSIPIRIGTRASTLARWQATAVKEALERSLPKMTFELVEIGSHGDSDRTTPLTQIGTVGIFTKRLEAALLAGEIDIAVHSLKDMPTAVAAGLTLGAFLPREDPRDALLSRNAASVASLPKNAVVATGSIRRRAQLSAQRPDLTFAELRGNIETRLEKLHASEWDGMILATAGLRRLGLAADIMAPIDPSELLPAVGQGIMTAQYRTDDGATAELLREIDDRSSRAAALAERALLRHLEGGCQVPIGALASIDGEELLLEAAVVSPDGTRAVNGRGSGRIGEVSAPTDAEIERIGIDLAERLIEEGAESILREIRHPRSEP